MTVTETSEPVVARRFRARFAAFLGLVAVGTTVSGALLDHVTVAGPAGVASVRFGLPFGWLAQNQSSLDPRFPFDATFVSPWEYPTSVAVGPLALNVLVVYSLLAVGLIVVRAIRHRR